MRGNESAGIGVLSQNGQVSRVCSDFTGKEFLNSPEYEEFARRVFIGNECAVIGLIHLCGLMAEFGIRHPFVLDLLLAVAVVAFVNLTFGTYFDHYEASVNALISGEFSGRIDWSSFVPVWFMTIPLLSWLTEASGWSHVYAAWFTLLNTLILGVLLTVVRMSSIGQGKAWRVLISFATVLLFMDSLMHVYSLKVSFFSTIAAVALVDIGQQKGLRKWYVVAAVALCLISITARLEIAVIASGLAMCGAFLLSGRKNTLVFASVLFVVSLSTFTFYKAYQAKVYPDEAAILCAEQAFDDRYNVSHRDFVDEGMRLKVMAMQMYIRDDGVYDIDDITAVTCSMGIVEYISDGRFPSIYFKKLEGLAEELQGHRWLLLLCAIFFAMTCAMLVLHDREKGLSLALRAIVLFLLAFVLMPLAVNVYASMAYGLIVCMATATGMGCLMALANMRQPVAKGACLAFCIAYAAATAAYGLQVKDAEHHRQENGEVLRQMLTSIITEGKVPVLLHTLPYEVYPARLFSGTFENRVSHYAADHFLSRYRFFTQYNQRLFGDGYSSLSSKFITMAGDDVAVIAMENRLDFYRQYMVYYHGMDVGVEKITTLEETGSVAAYRVAVSPADSIK